MWMGSIILGMVLVGWFVVANQGQFRKWQNRRKIVREPDPRRVHHTTFPETLLLVICIIMVLGLVAVAGTVP